MKNQYWHELDDGTKRAFGLKQQGRIFRNKDRVRLEVTTRRIGLRNTFKRFYLFVYDDKEGMTRCIGDNYETAIEAVTEAAQLFRLEKW